MAATGRVSADSGGMGEFWKLIARSASESQRGKARKGLLLDEILREHDAIREYEPGAAFARSGLVMRQKARDELSSMLRGVRDACSPSSSQTGGCPRAQRMVEAGEVAPRTVERVSGTAAR